MSIDDPKKLLERRMNRYIALRKFASEQHFHKYKGFSLKLINDGWIILLFCRKMVLYLAETKGFTANGVDAMKLGTYAEAKQVVDVVCKKLNVEEMRNSNEPF